MNSVINAAVAIVSGAIARVLFSMRFCMFFLMYFE
jgi:hypothetical protein